MKDRKLERQEEAIVREKNKRSDRDQLVYLEQRFPDGAKKEKAKLRERIGKGNKKDDKKSKAGS